MGKMLQYVLVVGATLGAFWWLQGLEDRRADARGEPRPGMARRAMLFFFLLLVFGVLSFYFGGMFAGGAGARAGGGADADGSGSGRAEAIEAEMIGRIHEPVRVGIPPF